MMLRMDGLGKREWTESLDTTDESVARTRGKVVHERVERVFREAQAGVKSPAVVGYRAVQAWRNERTIAPSRDGEEEALDSHLTTLPSVWPVVLHLTARGADTTINAGTLRKFSERRARPRSGRTDS
jgi:hypothetical protein